MVTLPGWQGSEPEHWQSHWEQLHAARRVQQHDWSRPLRGDWMMQLEEAVLTSPTPLLLVAHSLGCWLAAAWASHSRHTGRVLGAMLVAPPDPALFHVEPALFSWRSTALERLPFPSLLVSSDNDSYCSAQQAAVLAQGWGSTLVTAGLAGHINAASQLGAWPQGHAFLQQWLAGIQNQTTED